MGDPEISEQRRKALIKAKELWRFRPETARGEREFFVSFFIFEGEEYCFGYLNLNNKYERSHCIRVRDTAKCILGHDAYLAAWGAKSSAEIKSIT
jgi:hypothetical protein